MKRKTSRIEPLSDLTAGKDFAPQKISKIIVLPRNHPQSNSWESAARTPELVIGVGVLCRALVTGRGTLKIDGHLEGEIRTSGTLLVGPQALVKAQIEVGTIVSHGHIVGTVRARESVHLSGTAILEGAVTTPTLTMDEGARLETNWSLWMHGAKIPGPRWAERYQRGPIAHPAWWR